MNRFDTLVKFCWYFSGLAYVNNAHLHRGLFRFALKVISVGLTVENGRGLTISKFLADLL